MKRILAALTAVALATLGALVVPAAAFAAGTVTGTITNESSVGIPGAVIEFKYPGSTNYYYGDANGHFTATPPAHDYTVYIHAPGYAPEYYDDSYSASGAAVVSVVDGGTLTLDATLAPASSITGSVTTYASAPASAQVFAFGSNDTFGQVFSTSTNPATGAYTIDNLAPGSYKVYVSTSDTDDLVDEWFNNAYTQSAATPVVISTAGSSATANVQLAQGGSLQGSVLNTIGSPLEVAVEINNGSFSGNRDNPDAAGNYLINGLLPGTYTADANDPSGFFQDATSEPFTISTSSPSTANFVLTPAFPDESKLYETPALSGPSSVTAGETYTWTVDPGGDSDVYAMLLSDPVFLGAAVQSDGTATLSLTIPADTSIGSHKLVYASYDSEFNSPSYYYFPLDVSAAAGGGGDGGGGGGQGAQIPHSTPDATKLASTGAEATPFLLWSTTLLLLGAALVITRRLSRR